MRLLSTLILCSVLAAACETRCDTCDWPPFEERLTGFFDENQTSLEQLEQEMLADDIDRMNAGILSGTVPTPGAPLLDRARIEKYRRLLGQNETNLSVLRRPEATEFELPSEPVDTSLYLFRFVHGTAVDEQADCDASMKELPCGHCSIELQRDWRLEYEWFPQDLDVEARVCR